MPYCVASLVDASIRLANARPSALPPHEEKRTIDGRVYDVATSTHVAKASAGAGDYAWHEELFTTAKGIYFLRGRGGGLTLWGRPSRAGGRVAGAGIIRLSPAQAAEWAKMHGVTLGPRRGKSDGCEPQQRKKRKQRKSP